MWKTKALRNHLQQEFCIQGQRNKPNNIVNSKLHKKIACVYALTCSSGIQRTARAGYFKEYSIQLLNLLHSFVCTLADIHVQTCQYIKHLPPPAGTCWHLCVSIAQLFKTGKRFVDKSQQFVGTCLNEIVARIFQNIAALKDVFIINKSCISKTSTNIPSQTQQYLRLVHLLNSPSWLKVQVCVAQVHC